MRLHELGWWAAWLGPSWSRKLKRHQHSPSLLRLPTFRPAPGTKTVWGTIAALSKLFLEEHFPQPRAARQSGAIRDSEAHVQYGSCEQTPQKTQKGSRKVQSGGTRLEYRAAGMTTKVKSGRRSVTSPDTKGRPRGLGYIGKSWLQEVVSLWGWEACTCHKQGIRKGAHRSVPLNSLLTGQIWVASVAVLHPFLAIRLGTGWVAAPN